MPAEVTLYEGNCDPVVYTPVSSIRFCSADVPNPGTNYPVPVPVTEGVVLNSYWKNHRLHYGGTFTKVWYIRWFTNGDPGWNLGDGGKVIVGSKPFYLWDGTYLGRGCWYYRATGRPGVSGDSMDDKGPYKSYYDAEKHVTYVYTKNAFYYTPGRHLYVDVVEHESSFLSLVVMTQCVVGVGADRGVFPAFKCSWVWYEL